MPSQDSARTRARTSSQDSTQDSTIFRSPTISPMTIKRRVVMEGKLELGLAGVRVRLR